MNDFLAIATLLGGASALWFFWEKALSWVKHRSEAPRSTWAYGATTTKAIIYYLAFLSSIASAGFTELLRTSKSPVPGAAFLALFSTSCFWLFTDGKRLPSIWSLLRGAGAFLFGVCMSLLLLFMIIPDGLIIPKLGIVTVPDANPNLVVVPFLGSIAGIGGGITGLKEILEGRTLASALAGLLITFWFNLFAGTTVLVSLDGLIGIVVAFLVSSIITGGIVYLVLDDLASATHNSTAPADRKASLSGR